MLEVCVWSMTFLSSDDFFLMLFLRLISETFPPALSIL